MNHFCDLLAQLTQMFPLATDEAKVMGVIEIIGSRVLMTIKVLYKYYTIWPSQHPCEILRTSMIIATL